MILVMFGQEGGLGRVKFCLEGGGYVVPHHWLGGGVGSVALWPLGGGDVVQQVLAG